MWVGPNLRTNSQHPSVAHILSDQSNSASIINPVSEALATYNKSSTDPQSSSAVNDSPPKDSDKMINFFNLNNSRRDSGGQRKRTSFTRSAAKNPESQTRSSVSPPRSNRSNGSNNDSPTLLKHQRIIDLTLSSEDETRRHEASNDSESSLIHQPHLYTPSRQNSKSTNSSTVTPKSVSQINDSSFKNTAAQSDLASSPIKLNDLRSDSNTPSPPRAIPSSSPFKRKKTVAFSSLLVSDAPSSPVPNQTMVVNDVITPRKSILKPNLIEKEMTPLDPNNTALWVKSTASLKDTQHNAPSNPSFWLPGSIIQLPPDSPDLPQLVTGCLSVLRDPDFNRKFEVYATLNHICKSNTSDVLMKLFVSIRRNHAYEINNNNNNNGSNSPIPSIRTKSPTLLDENHVNEFAFLVRRDITSIEVKIFNKSSGPASMDIDSPMKESQTSPQTPDHRNRTMTPTKNDPFSIRVISQALRFMFLLISNPDLNNFLSVSEIKWFYVHSCETIIKPEISKTLLLPYLTIIKDCKFVGRKKKLIFEQQGDTSVSEHMLFSLLNMKIFPSSSLVVEKFITLRNLVSHFPVMMAQNLQHWFGMLVINLCDFTSPLYSKIITMGISALLEVARNYLDNRDILYSVRNFMESPLPLEIKSFSSDMKIHISDSDFSNNSDISPPRGIEYVSNCLETLIENGQYKPAMDIWVGLTLLCGDSFKGFEKWSNLNMWLKIHKMCFNKQDTDARIIAVTSWKAIVYNVCVNDLANVRKLVEPLATSNNNHNIAGGIDSPSTPKNPIVSNRPQQLSNNALRPKVKLLIHILLNVSSFESEKEVIDALHNLFVSIIYTLYNPLTVRDTLKYSHIYWDRVVQPVLLGFYFKKDSNTHMNQLGLRLLSRLLKGATPVSEKNFNDIRCLSIEPMNLSEINSLNPKWIHSRFDRILQTIFMVFKLDKLNVESKANYFIIFLNSLKAITRKELKTSDTTFDIIDNLPYALEILFKHNKVSFNLLSRILTALYEAFGGHNLINTGGLKESSTSVPNVYTLVLQNTINDLNSIQLADTLSGMLNSVGDKMQLQLLSPLLTLNQELKREDLDKFITDNLNTSRANITNNADLEVTSNLLKVLDHDFNVFAKRLIQDMVLSKQEEFERIISILKVHQWSLPIFKFFIILIHDAPWAHLKQMALNLILLRWEQIGNFTGILKFLVDNQLDLEIFNLRRNIMKKISTLQGYDKYESEQIWSGYLKTTESGGNFVLFDELLLSSFEGDFNIEPFAKGNWNKLPLLKHAWDTKHGLDESVIAEESVQPSIKPTEDKDTVSSGSLSGPHGSNDSTQRDHNSRSENETADSMNETVVPVYQPVDGGSKEPVYESMNSDDQTMINNSNETSLKARKQPESEPITCDSHEMGTHSLANEQAPVEKQTPMLPEKAADKTLQQKHENILDAHKNNVRSTADQAILANESSSSISTQKDIVPDSLSDTSGSVIETDTNDKRSKKKSKSPSTKIKKKHKKTKDDKVEAKQASDDKSKNFDIHSFTALLNAKLTPDTTASMSKAERKKVRKKLQAQKAAIEASCHHPVENHLVKTEIPADSDFSVITSQPSSESSTIPDMRLQDQISQQTDSNDSLSASDKSSFSQSSAATESDKIEDSAETERSKKGNKRKRDTAEKCCAKKVKIEPTIVPISSKEISDSLEVNKGPHEPSLGNDINSVDVNRVIESCPSSLESNPSHISFDSQHFKAHSTAVRGSSFEENRSVVATVVENETQGSSKPSLPVVPEVPEEQRQLAAKVQLHAPRRATEAQATSKYLRKVLENVSEDAIQGMDLDEKHKLETELLKFMLRLRSSNGPQH